MRNLWGIMVMIILFLPLGSWAGDATLQLSLDSRFDSDYYRNGGFTLRFLSEKLFAFGQGGLGYIDGDLGANIWIDSLKTSATNSNPIHINLYRGWIRWSTPQIVVRLGKQEVNFGPARILRSLRWFDARNPLDPLSITSGVWALTGRYTWLNNANAWVWCIYDQSGDPPGIDRYRGNPNSFQNGGRLQYPIGLGNLALTVHQRKVVHLDSPEWRFALDGQWDVGIGIWFEAVRIIPPKGSALSWMNLATIGGDYTLGIGNGVYVLVEYQYQRSLMPDRPVQTIVTQLNYPISLIDQIFTLTMYNDYRHFSGFYLGWQRQYDQLSWQFLVGYLDQNITGTGNAAMGMISRQSIQLTLMYSI